MQKVIDFMGDDSVWATMVPGVEIRRRLTQRAAPVPTAYFIDSHWTARRAGETVRFDPYDQYQKPGTHRFCQTFAMMYLLGVLPPPRSYSENDARALAFIRSVIEKLPADHPGFQDSKEVLTRLV